MGKGFCVLWPLTNTADDRNSTKLARKEEERTASQKEAAGWPGMQRGLRSRELSLPTPPNRLPLHSPGIAPQQRQTHIFRFIARTPVAPSI